ncbi:MAG: UDP-N-acetylmuramate dehydrogenase [Deltaproteobacteria bacterium]|nr:UDP-N-acetylmuramate dehydrogenase [Deltaproteobacteria bacterium]
MNGFEERLRQFFRGEIRLREPMARHTTWQVGGPADFFLMPADRDDLLALVGLLEETATPWLVLGKGSNVLVSDAGVAGVVIDTARLNRLDFLPDGTVRAEAGTALGHLVDEAARRGWAGLEYLAGIPGSVGGALVMNAGVPEHEFGDVVTDALLAGEKRITQWPVERLGLCYRGSALDAGHIVVEVGLRLMPGAPDALQSMVAEMLKRRSVSQNVCGANAGSVFRNPPGGKAWQLIDEAGFRGVAEGGARVAPQHTNFIVNEGRASAADIRTLIQRIQREVQQKFNVRLEPEIKMVGRDVAGNGR